MDMDIIKRFICGAKEAHKKVDNHSFNFPITIESAYRLATNIEELLKEQELQTELKQKMWNALYAEEDEYEKKFVGKEEHLNWFTVYRPWLQKGFDIAINAIADWEGR